MPNDHHIQMMKLALDQAKIAYEANEVPVGAIITNKEKVVGVGSNKVIRDLSVCSHAEINAIRDASKKIGNYRLYNSILYSTLEPCHMCAKAIVDARIKKVYFATPEPKTGAIISVDSFFNKAHLNFFVQHEFGLLQKDSEELLKKFFKERR